MVRCLTVPSHYLTHCWLVLNDGLWHSPGNDFPENDGDDEDDNDDGGDDDDYDDNDDINGDNNDDTDDTSIIMAMTMINHLAIQRWPICMNC